MNRDTTPYRGIIHLTHPDPQVISSIYQEKIQQFAQQQGFTTQIDVQVFTEAAILACSTSQLSDAIKLELAFNGNRYGRAGVFPLSELRQDINWIASAVDSLWAQNATFDLELDGEAVRPELSPSQQKPATEILFYWPSELLDFVVQVEKNNGVWTSPPSAKAIAAVSTGILRQTRPRYLSAGLG